MSISLEYRARERQRKRESTRQACEAQWEKGRQRSRPRDKKQKQRRSFFVVGKTTWKFAAEVTKWEMLAATNTRWKWAAVRKKSEREHVTRFPPKKKRVTKKFLEVSRCSRAKQRQQNVPKSLLHVQNKNYTGLSSESWALRKLICEVSIFTPKVLFPIYIAGSKIQ